jgi:FkbM family methyltransferase
MVRLRAALFTVFRWVFVRVLGTTFAKQVWRIPGAHGFYQWLMPRLRPSAVMVDGHLIELDPLDSLLLSVNGNYEAFEQSLFVGCVRSGDTVLDIGAHIGLYTLQAARAAGPQGRVFAFEPSVENFALLVRNIEGNGYENVHAERVAVSDREGHAELSLSAANTGDHSLVTVGTAGRRTERVQTVAVDGISELSTIDVVKLDVQGAEPSVIAGARLTLDANEDVLMFMELSPGHLQDWGGTQQFVMDLSQAGFEFFVVDEAARRVSARTPAEMGSTSARTTADFVNVVCVKGSGARERLVAACASSGAQI